MHFGLVLYVYTPSRKVATTAEVEEHKHNTCIQPSLLTSPWPVPGLADCPRSEEQTAVVIIREQLTP